MPENADCDAIEPFAELVGRDVIELIFEVAPRKVRSRVEKALDHYTKALRLVGVDDEMGAIRLIAAEEELVVANFEWLKLRAPNKTAQSEVFSVGLAWPDRFSPMISGMRSLRSCYRLGRVRRVDVLRSRTEPH